MASSRVFKAAFKSSSVISWKSAGKLQQTVVNCIERTGLGLHSGKKSTVRIWPELAGEGRYFMIGSNRIDASIDFAKETPLCTTLCKDGYTVRTIEHLLSALEASGVDNCRIEIENSVSDDQSVEVPIFDGSAREWVNAIEEVGLKVAADSGGKSCDKLAPYVNERFHVWKNDTFVAAFPSSKLRISYGINFPQAPAIGCQWFSCSLSDNCVYVEQIASSRTFCIYEQVEQMLQSGLIQGGSLESAIVCSSEFQIAESSFASRNSLAHSASHPRSSPDFTSLPELAGRPCYRSSPVVPATGHASNLLSLLSESKGWLNPPLRYNDEPCRHKVLDLIGDLSLFARAGSQGLPVAHIVAYKGGHALHTDFARRLSRID